MDQKVMGIKKAKADVPQSRALGAAGLEVALPVLCPGTPSTLGRPPSRDLGFSHGSLALLAFWGVGAAPHAASAATGTHGAKHPTSHSDQHPACHIQIHVFSHLSCSKDLKCIEGPWEKASLTKGKKEKHTAEPALPMQQALRLLCWKTSTFPSRQS